MRSQTVADKLRAMVDAIKKKRESPNAICVRASLADAEKKDSDTRSAASSRELVGIHDCERPALCATQKARLYVRAFCTRRAMKEKIRTRFSRQCLESFVGGKGGKRLRAFRSAASSRELVGIHDCERPALCATQKARLYGRAFCVAQKTRFELVLPVKVLLP